MRNLIVCVMLLTGACATTTQPTAMVPIAPPAPTSQVEGGGIRVGLVGIDGPTITLQVVNLGDEPVVLDRSAIKMVLPLGDQRTRSANLESTNVYGIPGQGIQLVRLRYDFDGVLDSDVVQLDFDHAVTRGDRPVAIPRFAFKPKA
jgi:hypothetical protein